MIKGTDIYGIPINLTYEKANSFRTVSGGYLSILTAILVLIYFIDGCKDVVKKKSIISMQNSYDNEATDPTIFQINHESVDFLYKFLYQGTNPKFEGNQNKFLQV